MSLRPPFEIGLIAYPGAQEAALHGLSDNFRVAERLAQERQSSSKALFKVSCYALDDTRMRVVPAAGGFGGLPSGIPDIVIAPPCLGSLPDRETIVPIAGWLKERHAAGAVVASVCAGAFLLAQAGLLDGRTATTHWVYANMLAKDYPAVTLDIDKLVIDDGDIITAGGVMAWTDLSLKIIGNTLGSAAMIETARFLLIDPPGREQRNYSSFSPVLTHGDGAILKVQQWLPSVEARKLTVEMMAERAGLTERTFIRRFEKATGLRPTEYRQNVRMDQAREMLGSTERSIEQIAWTVGYDDVSAFRKVFLKTTGLLPAFYRKKFGAIPVAEIPPMFRATKAAGATADT
jgi:transcriptional regulator GlxA family with amidase domain